MAGRLVLAVAALFLIGCGRHSDNSDKLVVHTVYMGNPLNLIKGTQRDTAFWNGQNFKDGETVWLVNLVSYEPIASYTTGKTRTQQTLEQEESAHANPDDSGTFRGLPFKVSIGYPDMSVTLTSQHIRVKIYQSQKVENPPIEIYLDGQPAQPSSLMHVSFNQKKNIFTLLTYEAQPKGDESLTYWLFQKFPLEIDLRTLRPNKRFQYIRGPGIYANWKSNINLNLCGATAAANYGYAQHAVKEWNAVLPADRQIQLSIPQSYRPFSDLNQHCLYVLDDVLADPHPNEGKMGITMPIVDLSQLEIVDADIFIYTREFDKSGHAYGSLKLAPLVQYTFTHEMGHFLGLDHQFDPNEDSIMAYSFKATGVTPYDRDAIRELYGITAFSQVGLR